MYTDGLGGRSAPTPSAYMPSHDKEKVRAIGCYRTRDGRHHISCQVSATLSTGKSALLLVVVLLLAGYLLAPAVGMGPAAALKRRVYELERAMGKKLTWVLENQRHIRQRVLGGKGGVLPPSSSSSSSSSSSYADEFPPPSFAGDGVVAGNAHADGRKHLLVPPDGISRLAEALAPSTTLAAFDDHYLCGEEEVTEGDVIRKTIALAAVTWKAPLSLRNSMESWRRGGLLDIVDERMLFINSPSEEDYAIAQEYDFDVYTTTERNGNIMAGPSIAYLSGNSSADYILFMEKDFVLSADRATMLREMYTGVQHLARGVDAYRLRGKSDHPAEGMPDCCTPKEPPTCPYMSGWKSGGYFGDHMNWLTIFCDPNIIESANGRVAKCTSEPDAPASYCFTSGETNWSNNPVLFSRTWFNKHVRKVAFLEENWVHNELFEFHVTLDWLAWRPPAKVCTSFQGIFTHYEVDQ
jgi:hypothetical protein